MARGADQTAKLKHGNHIVPPVELKAEAQGVFASGKNYFIWRTTNDKPTTMTETGTTTVFMRARAIGNPASNSPPFISVARWVAKDENRKTTAIHNTPMWEEDREWSASEREGQMFVAGVFGSGSGKYYYFPKEGSNVVSFVLFTPKHDAFTLTGKGIVEVFLVDARSREVDLSHPISNMLRYSLAADSAGCKIEPIRASAD